MTDNEDRLVKDLIQQQKMSKDTLDSLKEATFKFESLKREMVKKVESEKKEEIILLQHELSKQKEKFEV